MSENPPLRYPPLLIPTRGASGFQWRERGRDEERGGERETKRGIERERCLSPLSSLSFEGRESARESETERRKRERDKERERERDRAPVHREREIERQREN